MGIVVSMVMIAAGAIMRFAVTVQGHGFNVHTTGMVLMVVGVIGAVLSIAFWAGRDLDVGSAIVAAVDGLVRYRSVMVLSGGIWLRLRPVVCRAVGEMADCKQS